ncbi:MAG: hypothetical protein ACD_17C00031G0002 [uncultured bacterium]|nr:MAG: hypothetical protein ACD_17C00031G0002 [uncultured bacterium]
MNSNKMNFLLLVLMLMYIPTVLGLVAAFKDKSSDQKELNAAFGDNYRVLVAYGVSDAFEYAKPLMDDGKIRDYSGRLVMLKQSMIAGKEDWNSSEAEKKYRDFLLEVSEAIYYDHALFNDDSVMKEKSFPEQKQREAFQKYSSLKKILEELEIVKNQFFSAKVPADALQSFVKLGNIQAELEILRAGSVQK